MHRRATAPHRLARRTGHHHRTRDLVGSGGVQGGIANHQEEEKKEIWRPAKPNHEERTEYFSAFTGEHRTRKRGYRLHWIYSSEKRHRDRVTREEHLCRAEQALRTLNTKLNTRHLKERDAIETGW